VDDPALASRNRSRDNGTESARTVAFCATKLSSDIVVSAFYFGFGLIVDKFAAQKIGIRQMFYF
jgi:hypothetical protein